MERLLNAVERRVLGALLEKSMAQPEYYPMTEKALTAACNQKHNRDPVTELTEDEVFAALEALRQRGLVTVVLPGPGARTKRYKHAVESFYGWQKRERALMTELLLRGPQTPGELRSRCSRFVPFDDLEAVMIVLDCLAGADPPVVSALPREPGRSAIRYTHLLYPEGEEPVVDAAAVGAARDPAPASGEVQAQLDALHTEVAELRAALTDAVNRVESLEKQLL